MNKIVLTLLLAIMIVSPCALAEMTILDDDRATLELTVLGEFFLESTGPGASVSSAEAELTWFSRETYNQNVEDIDTRPIAEAHDDNYLYTWKNPELGSHKLSLTSLISTNNDITPITTKEIFPLPRVDADLAAYTQASKMIDMNPAIKNLAGNLAAGKDNQYEVVFALADWVTTNIEYELSSITAEVNYPSSWVLEQRYGVCDEMTNLFISLNRALGIPSRFVSGLAYTDMEEVPENWGGHGWAEVWFPSVGWVPFDVTYGEYGYIDAGHIKLKDSIDSDENSIEYSGTGRNFELKSRPLDFAVDVLGTSPKRYDIIEAELTPFAKEIGFGGYNLLTLRLKNLRDYYVSTRVEIGQTTKMIHESSDEKNVLLKPYEEKELQFLVRVEKNLDPEYIYTFPVTAYTKLGSPVETSFKATPRGTLLDEDIMSVEEEKIPLNVEIECTTPSPVRVGKTTVSCIFKNKEKTTLRDYEACVAETCETISLRYNAEKTIDGEISKDTPGVYAIVTSISDDDRERSVLTTLNVLDETKLGVTNKEIPATILYDEMGALKFTIERLSVSAPTSATVIVKHPYFSQTWEDQQILSKQDFNLNFWGRGLKAGENELTIVVEYTDAFGEKHTLTDTANISLVNLSFGQRFMLWMDSTDRWLQNTFA